MGDRRRSSTDGMDDHQRSSTEIWVVAGVPPLMVCVFAGFPQLNAWVVAGVPPLNHGTDGMGGRWRSSGDGNRS